jgi:uncharacterized protein (DUF1015 family)
MITIAPFKALRPPAQLAKAIASRPYDVLNRKEAKVEAQGNPYSFLHITKSELGLPESIDAYDTAVYSAAKENLNAFISKGNLFLENKPCYYIYKLVMDGIPQTGLVCVSSVDDYENGLIKKHEFTRPQKEKDRIDHMAAIGAQTGNVFLAYKNDIEIDALILKWQTEKNPQYEFVADDGIEHSVWIVSDDATIEKITMLFKRKIEASYIADGHHRAASAAKVREHMGANAPAAANYFLTTLFPSNQLRILDYNRIVKDLNGHSVEEFMRLLQEKFDVSPSAVEVKPEKPMQMGMYVAGHWYSLEAKPNTYSNDVVGVLDISIFQDNILTPIFNITDQRTDDRIDFVGGIRGINALTELVDSNDFAAAFSFYPVSIDQLFDVADSGEVMPPKSTWFEPKLRDGLLTHLLVERNDEG